MPMCQSIHPSIIWQHAVPYVIVWIEMAKCRSVHRNIIWQHAAPDFILRVGMAMCWSVYSNIMYGNMPVHTVYNMGRNSNVPISPSKHYLWQHACPYVILWVEMAMCQSVHPNSIWQHAGPYIIVWVEMATCWSSH